MDNPSDIFSLCRLCLVKDQVNISIFDEQGDIRQIFLKISSCLPIKVSRDDKLPKKICDDCSNKLDLLYEFWNSSANAEKTLLSWLGQAGVKDAGGTINAVAQQIAKPTETLVKLESGVVEGNSVLISPCVNNVDNESFNELPKEESEAAPPPPKRTRRSAAVKAQINIIPESEDDDDIDTTDLPTKLEDGPEDSDAEDKDPSYTEVPGTSANDQPGPSGVGKAGGVEAQKLILIPLRTECLDCNVIFSTEELLHEHELKICLQTRCKICKILVATKQLGHHMSYHKRECRDQLGIAANLEDIHLKFIDKKTLYKCNICDKIFHSKNGFKKHRFNKHVTQNLKSLQCEKCGKIFHEQQIYSRHLRFHKNVVKCDICNKSLCSRGSLNDHMRLHSGERPFICEHCGKGFRTLAIFQNHLVVHTKKRNHICKYCGRTFTQRSPLKSHMVKFHGTRQ